MFVVRPRKICVLTAAVLFLVAGNSEQSWGQVTATGLDPYQHTYHPEHGYVPVANPYAYGFGGYGGYGVGTAGSGVGTAAAGAGVAAAGVGQLAEGVGQARLSTAQAQEAHQQAASQYLNNVAQYQDTAIAFGQKKEQAQQQYDDATKAKVEQQVALYNKTLHQMSAAHRLTAEQMDVSTGVLHWPFVLRGPDYTDLRKTIDKLWDARTPEDSGENSSTYDPIQQACTQMMDLVKKEVGQGMPVNDFVTAKHFISSIEYEAQFPVKAAK
jgi:X-X-X-Leu-X-X-Gly heptad repeat protein